MAKTLKDVMPPEFLNVEFEKTRSRKHVDVEVVEEHGMTSDKPWPGGHKNVNFWVLLKNGRAVGWNESPSHGWSFPIITHKAD